jgi:hypothetical protein
MGKYPGKAELNAKWWRVFIKKAPRELAKDLKQPGMAEALDEYEVAEDQLDVQRMADVLKVIRDKLPRLIKTCNRHQDYDAEKLLQQLLLLHKKKTTWVQKMDAADKGREAAPKQKVGKPTVYFSADMNEEVRKHYKSERIQLSGYKVELDVNGDIPDLLKESGDTVTLHKIVDHAQKATDQVARDIAKRWEQLDKILDKIEDEEDDDKWDKVTKAETKQVESDIKKLEKHLTKVPQLVWDKWKASNKQYQFYKVKCGCRITLGGCKLAASGVGVGGSVAGMFGPPGSQTAAIPGLIPCPYPRISVPKSAVISVMSLN